jgi:hypothetical protein
MDFSVDFFHCKGIRSLTDFIQSTLGAAALTSFSSFIKMYISNPVFRPVFRPQLGSNLVSQDFSSD